MPTLDDLLDGDGEWPPEPHAERIETQLDYSRLYRNRRDELLQRWSGDLLRYVNRQEDLVPFPAAKIAARTLAAFLFGEDPRVTHPDEAIVDAVDRMAAATVLTSRLLEGAITQSVQGECYLRPAWDSEVSPAWPVVTPIPGAQVIPTFRFGMLVDAAIVTEYRTPGRKASDNTVWRLVEQHESGKIRYALFRGTSDRLGRPVGLDTAPAYVPNDGLVDELDTQIDVPLIVHVPLGRDAESPHGVSIFDGLESLIMGLHRLYSQEQHDAEIVRRRIAIAEAHLPRDAAGRPTFDRKSDLFVLSEDAQGAVGAEGKPVHPIEFQDDNVQRDRIAGRFRDFLMACGISPDTIAADEPGGATSGTARKLAQAMTIQTASAAGRYWQDAIARVLAMALEIARVHLDGGDLPALEELPTVTLSDGLIDDPVELARMVVDLDTAEAISTIEKVRLLHPEWTPKQIEEEVARILDAMAPPPPAIAPFGPLAAEEEEQEPEEPESPPADEE